MKAITIVFAAILASSFGARCVFADDDHTGQPLTSTHERLGKVHFVTSCDPAVGKNFDHSVALLHSFWTKDAIKAFNIVLKQDPDCAIAYWESRWRCSRIR